MRCLYLRKVKVETINPGAEKAIKISFTITAKTGAEYFVKVSFYLINDQMLSKKVILARIGVRMFLKKKFTNSII
ncbi:DUF4981 domain-containing protein [Flavobacterium chungbukense]|uniref:Uncharacterized protein n=1 Tax=Flavobacterium chungbukense TaxID=877464 RepID=A0ABP7Y836_9FLAO|nr:DUF4981 domain-containing protein [Flavobacterium chungbukense]MCC4923849.1 DUF4981 domain-containing protein [Flavobacterium chungbukense]